MKRIIKTYIAYLLMGDIMKIDFKKLLISIGIPLIVGLVSGLISMPFMDFDQLVNPPLSPPGWLFPIVWTILYILMGISFYIIWESKDSSSDNAYLIYFLQLFVNFFWSIFFFVFKLRLFSIFWLILLISLIILMIIKFYSINKTSGLLQIPYLLWCLFATYLNVGIYLLN